MEKSSAGIRTVSVLTAEREASGKLPGKGAKPLAQLFKSEIRSTKPETNSNEINTNDKNNSDPMGNLATGALSNFTHCYNRLDLTVLNIWTFVFEICFEFRDSFFVFFKRHLSLTGSVEPFGVHHWKWWFNAGIISACQRLCVHPVSSGPLCVRIDDHLTGIGGLPHDVETIGAMIKVNPV